ncbi:hypothetical protein [Sulfurimonas sp. HSL3-7]
MINQSVRTTRVRVNGNGTQKDFVHLMKGKERAERSGYFAAEF